jgi:hypothetical protein
VWRQAGTVGAAVNDVVLVDKRQSSCGTVAFCRTDPAPDAPDQATDYVNSPWHTEHPYC